MNLIKKLKNQRRRLVANDLETTSEGLCDHVREIFGVDRSSFNEYEVRAMRRLLVRKSHSQILKEELRRQELVIERDKHPFYRRECFQSDKCYALWKQRAAHRVRSMLAGSFAHVHVDEEEDLVRDQVLLDQYASKLHKFASVFYDKLVKQIFR